MSKHPNTKFLLGLWWGVFFCLLSSCAIFGGGSSDVQRAEDYEISAPKDWRALNRGEADQAYKLPSGNIVTVTSSCERHSGASLEVLTRQLFIGSREVDIENKNRRMVDRSVGLHSSATATVNGRKFYTEMFVWKKHGCVFDLSMLSHKKEVSEKDMDSFVAFIRTLKYGDH